MRKYFARNPTTGVPIVVHHGETGYYPLTDGAVSDALLDRLNESEGNTDKDVEIAVAASMFGWDVPAVADISEPS